MASDEYISLSEASRRAGVPTSTLKRWAEEKIIPVTRGRWTPVAAAQARVVARMRERGHSLEELKDAGREGKLAFGLAEELFPPQEGEVTIEQAAEQTGLEAELIERLQSLFGTPTGREQTLTKADLEAMHNCARILEA